MTFKGTTKDALWNERVVHLLRISALEAQGEMLREAAAPLLRDIYRRTKDGASYCNYFRGGGEYEGWQTAGRVPHEDHCIYGPLETALAATDDAVKVWLKERERHLLRAFVAAVGEQTMYPGSLLELLAVADRWQEEKP